MGSAFSFLSSRRRVVAVNVDTNKAHPYGYPPIDGGNYFSTHYHLGSKKFETAEEELFLYGDMADINYLVPPPSAFPYKQPSRRQPIHCLNSLLNLHKETVKLVRSEADPLSFHIEFLFDSLTPCQITVFQSVPDSFTMDMLTNGSLPSPESVVSHVFAYEKGLEQSFDQCPFLVTPSEWEEDKLKYDTEEGQTVFPIGILIETKGNPYQSLITLCNFSQMGENAFNIKVLKQKLYVDGMEYLLHETFGMENKAKPKSADAKKNDDESQDEEDEDEDDDLGAECVVCFTDVKDTILLPCRHFCLCASCAADLRYQSSNCPICRARFRAILQMRALQPIDQGEILDDDDVTNNPEVFAVAGYKQMSLFQAVNGYPNPLMQADSTDIDAPMVVTTSTAGEDESQSPTSTSTAVAIPIDTEEKTGGEAVETIGKRKTSILSNEELCDLPDSGEGITQTPVGNGVAPKPLVISAAVESHDNTPTSRSSWTSEASQDSRELLIKNHHQQQTPPIPRSTSSKSYDQQSSTSTDSVASHDMLLPSPQKPLAKLATESGSSHVSETYC